MTGRPEVRSPAIRLALGLLLLLPCSAGADVVALGDSITRAPGNWCDLIDPGVTCRNYSQVGATAAPNLLGVQDAASQLDEALADGVPDHVILAFGTNDASTLVTQPPGNQKLLVRGPDAVADVLLILRDRAEAAGAKAFIGTVPPWFDPVFAPPANLFVHRMNAVLEASGADLIDFHTWVTREHMQPDGVHLNARGHRERAARVLVALPEPSYGLPAALVMLACLRRASGR